jgi:hypothetical protein
MRLLSTIGNKNQYHLFPKFCLDNTLIDVYAEETGETSERFGRQGTTFAFQKVPEEVYP